MAVSGHKLSDFRSSMSRGSAEDFVQSCVPCLSDGQHVEAHGFCVDCQEYLCKNCFHCHKKTKASRHHQLLDKTSMDKHSSLPKAPEVCIEKCSKHRNEIIKFFCPKHEELGCHDCMVMSHRNCDLDYIPDKCEGIGDSGEYIETIKKLELKINETETVMRKAVEKDKEIDDCHDNIIKDIEKFRKEINDHLDTLQKNIETEAHSKKSTSKNDIQKVLVSCSNIASKLNKLKTCLQTAKAGKQNGQLFIEIKRAKCELQPAQVHEAKMLLEKACPHYEFVCNKDLERVLSFGSLGTLSENDKNVTVPVNPSMTARRNRTFSNLLYKTDINVRTKTDISSCDITSCAVLPANRLLLSDGGNQKLKVIDMKDNNMLEEINVFSYPKDIAILPGDQIAVTLPHQSEILIMNTSSQLSISRKIKIENGCYGITFYQGCLYVISSGPKILVLDMKGHVKNEVALSDSSVFCAPNYILLSQDCTRLYVSNYSNESVVGIPLDFDLSAVATYKRKDLKGPKGMLVLDYGSLLVCCTRNKSIYHISGDLTQGQKVLVDANEVQSICYSSDKSEVYVGASNCNRVKVFSVDYGI